MPFSPASIFLRMSGVSLSADDVHTRQSKEHDIAFEYGVDTDPASHFADFQHSRTGLRYIIALLRKKRGNMVDLR